MLSHFSFSPFFGCFRIFGDFQLFLVFSFLGRGGGEERGRKGREERGKGETTSLEHPLREDRCFVEPLVALGRIIDHLQIHIVMPIHIDHLDVPCVVRFAEVLQPQLMVDAGDLEVLAPLGEVDVLLLTLLLTLLPLLLLRRR